MITARRVIALVLVLVAFDGIFSWFSTCAPYNQQSTDHDRTKHCGAFNGPVLSFTRFSLREAARFLKDYEHELVAGFTIVLGISTIGLWISTKKLWDAGERQLVHLGETAERQLRAYVGVYVSEQPNIGDDFMKVSLVVKNSGQTPAYDVRSGIGAGFRPYSAADIQPMAENDFPSDAAKLVINPGEEHEVHSTPIGIGGDREALIRGIDLRFYVWGLVVYTDAFRVKRYTRYCLEYGGPDCMRTQSMTWCFHGNEAT